MADKKIKVQVDVETNVEQSIAGLKALKKQLRDTAAGSDEFKRLANEIDDLEDKLKGAKAGAADWIDTLESAGGPIGALGGALNKAKVATISFGTALKAAGIGLIVAAVAGLVAAFSQQEGAMKKLQPLLIGFEKILGGIFKAFEPLLDVFIEMATSALPYITKGIGMFYSGLYSLFTLVKNVGVSAGKILKGIFTLDFDALKEGAAGIKDAFTSVGATFDATYKRFEEGTKQQTKTQKENLKTQKDDADKALQDKLKRMESEDKLDEARLEKLKQEALVLATTEQQKLDVEKAFAQKTYDLRLKDLTDKQALYQKDSIEYKNLEAEKIKLQSEFLNQTTAFGEKQKDITNKTSKELFDIEVAALQLRKAKGELSEKEYQQALFDIKAKYATDSKQLIDAEIALETYKTEQKKKLAEEERGIVANRLQAEFEDLDRKSKLADFDFEQDLARIQEQRGILAEQEKNDLANTDLTEFQKTEIRKKYADQRIALNTLEVDTEKAAMQAKHDINMAYLGLFEQFGNVLGQIAGKNKALAIAGVVISQAAAIGQIIASTGMANAKAVSASPLTFGAPWVLINTISAGLSIAATIAGAVKSIQQINSAASAAGVSGGGGGGSVGAAPALPKVSSASAPQIQTGGGMNPTQQIGETIAGAQKPIKAYVVSGDISSQQALDRRTNRAATFAGG